MKHSLAPGQYAVLGAIIVTSALGDTFLSRGMSQVGKVDAAHWTLLFSAMLNLNVIVGVLLLIVFFGSYMAALSWVDLTFLMPATAFGNVLIALLSRFWLHEHLSLSRWCGILLLTCAVGFVANGPSRTEHAPDSDPYAGPPEPMKLTKVDPGVGV